MRVVLAPEGSRGDVQPLLALGQALEDAGCEVAMCASPDAEALVSGHGIEFRAMPIDVREFIEANAALMVEGFARFRKAAASFFDEAMRQQFPALFEHTRDADLVIGGGIQLAAASAAEAHGIPHRLVAYCPTFLRSGDHPPFVVERQLRTPWLNRLLWSVFVPAYSWALRSTLADRRAELGLAPVAAVYDQLMAGGVLLATDPELAPSPADCPFPVEQLGFLFPPETEALPAKLDAFLDAGPKPVYIGFGSMPDPTPEATTRMLVESIGAAGVRAVISQGWGGLGCGPLPESVIVVGPVPHAKLFARVTTVVHHGGAGTTHTAARAGVPQLIVPHLLDQYYWAEVVRRRGLGPPAISRRQLTGNHLATFLIEATENEIIAERARELGERMRTRDPGANARSAAEEILRSVSTRARVK